MSSPIHLDDDTDPTLIYAPPWARERILPVAEPPFRSPAPTNAAAEMSSRKFKPKFSGDRAMLALQRQLALDPDQIPEPLSKGTAAIWPLLIRLCSVTALAAFVAWGLVSYSGVKKSAGITTSIQSRRRAAIAFTTNPFAGGGSDHPGREFTAACGLN